MTVHDLKKGESYKVTVRDTLCNLSFSAKITHIAIYDRNVETVFTALTRRIDSVSFDNGVILKPPFGAVHFELLGG